MNQKLYRVFKHTGDFLERHSRLASATLLAFVFLMTLAQAAGKPFSNDEIFTWLPASLPTWRDVWNFYAQGADTNSPLCSLLVHAMLYFPSTPEIVTRIPFMLTFLVLCLCLFVFVQRRYPAAYALAALLAPVVVAFLFFYSTENRAYMLMLAGVAFAAVCWQSANQPGDTSRWSAVGLWFGMAFAVCAHSFAVFVFIPFALAQTLADRERRKVNVSIWLALLLFPLGLLPVIHGQLAASHAFRSSFFAKPHWFMLQQTYEYFFFSVTTCGAMLLFSVIALVLRDASAAHENATKYSGLTRPEIVFAVSLAFMPIYVLPASMVIGVYRPPYVLPALMGIVLCIIAVLAEWTRRQSALGAALFAVMLLVAIQKFISLRPWRTLTHPGQIHTRIAQSYNRQPWIQMADNSGLPVAVANMNLYVTCYYYCPAALRQRLSYITDLSLGSQYPDSLTVQVSSLRLKKFIPLTSIDWNTFSLAHHDFLLVTGSPFGEWLPSYLIRQPRSRVNIEFLGPQFEPENPEVYEVKLLSPTASASASSQ